MWENNTNTKVDILHKEPK